MGKQGQAMQGQAKQGKQGRARAPIDGEQARVCGRCRNDVMDLFTFRSNFAFATNDTWSYCWSRILAFDIIPIPTCATSVQEHLVSLAVAHHHLISVVNI